MSWDYPAGSLAALIAGDAVTAPTRDALTDRATPPTPPAFFAAAEFAVLTAVVARLAPLPDLAATIAAAIDARLAAGNGNGWRYAELPADGAAYRAGLATIAVNDFLSLPPSGQDHRLRGVQAHPETARFFEELLAETTEFAYARPAALAAIGYAGLADAPGWSAIGLDEREVREPVEARDARGPVEARNHV